MHSLKIHTVFTRMISVWLAVLLAGSLLAQKPLQKAGYPDAIRPVGIIQGLSDSALLDLVQRQTFLYF
jgi:hypothetical protein